MAKTILLADDSITIQKVIELTFSDEDFEVVTVGNGRLAVERQPVAVESQFAIGRLERFNIIGG